MTYWTVENQTIAAKDVNAIIQTLKSSKRRRESDGLTEPLLKVLVALNKTPECSVKIKKLLTTCPELKECYGKIIAFSKH